MSSGKTRSLVSGFPGLFERAPLGPPTGRGLKCCLPDDRSPTPGALGRCRLPFPAPPARTRQRVGATYTSESGTYSIRRNASRGTYYAACEVLVGLPRRELEGDRPPLADTSRFVSWLNTLGRRGTSLVPDPSSDASRFSTAWDRWDVRDAVGRIWQWCPPAGGRAVAGSNPASPISESPHRKRASAFRRLFEPHPQVPRGTGLGTESLRPKIRDGVTSVGLRNRRSQVRILSGALASGQNAH